MARPRLVVPFLAAASAACVSSTPDTSRVVPLSAREGGIEGALVRDVTTLATGIGERNTAHPQAYARAAAFVAGELRAAGFDVREEPFPSAGMTVRNLIAEVRGSASQEIVLVGAHYDSAEGTPGANDNGSGVAALLALARHFGASHPARTLRFVAFANEEPPFFHGDEMGSLVHARGCAARGEKISAMISLETMGFFSDAADSQHYPFPLSLIYPTTGNFLAFVGNLASTGLTQRSVRIFRGARVLPAESAAVPDLVPGIGWSDHWSFWRIGTPAVMVTDTAPFRYPHYHEATDTPDKLDYPRLTRAVVGVAAVIDRLLKVD